MQAIAQFRQSLATERREARFKRTLIGWTLVILNTLAALNSTFFFLAMLRAGVVA